MLQHSNMTHTMSRRRRWMFLGAALAVVCLNGACSRTPRAAAAYVDSQPPPEEPLVSDGDVGSHGGRMIVPSDAAPTTFNPVMATTVGSNEIISQLFVRLTRH